MNILQRYPLTALGAVVIVGILIFALVILPENPTRERVLFALIPTFLVLLNVIRTEQTEHKVEKLDDRVNGQVATLNRAVTDMTKETDIRAHDREAGYPTKNP